MKLGHQRKGAFSWHRETLQRFVGNSNANTDAAAHWQAGPTPLQVVTQPPI